MAKLNNMYIMKANIPLIQLLFVSLISAIHLKRRERHRRHKIVRRHGLILPNRTRSWLAKYTKALSVKNGTENRMHTGRFVAFMQLLTGIEFDRIVEGLQYEVDLRKFLLKLVYLHFCCCFYSNKILDHIPMKQNGK